MTLETQASNDILGPDKDLFDFIREKWSNFKEYLSEKLSSFKETLFGLNLLKRDVAGNSWSDKLSDSREKDSKNIREKLLEIVSRSRKPESVCENDLWSVSLWTLQWHEKNAVKLLKRLRECNPSRFDSIMTDPLFRDLDKAWMSVWDKDKHTVQYKLLVEDEWCKQVIKDMWLETVDWYLSRISWWWVTDAKATLARWRMCNAWPWFAEWVKNDMVKNWKNINDYIEVIESYDATDFWKKYNKFWKQEPYYNNRTLGEVIGEYSA